MLHAVLRYVSLVRIIALLVVPRSICLAQSFTVSMIEGCVVQLERSGASSVSAASDSVEIESHDGTTVSRADLRHLRNFLWKKLTWRESRFHVILLFFFYYVTRRGLMIPLNA